jgi:hypothetical protein
MVESTGVAAAAVSELAVRPALRERSRFFVAMSIAMLVFVFLGFGQTLFLRPLFDVRPIPPYLYVHGAILTAWYAWFVVQTSLITMSRPHTHRRLGVVGVALGGAAVVVSAMTALRFAPRFAQLGSDVEARLLFFSEIVWLNISLLVCFSVFLVAAVALRKRPPIHKRLMFLASLSFIPPAITRIIDWPIWGLGNNAYVPLFCCLVGLILVLGVHDIFERRSVHPVTLLGGASLATLFAVCTFLMPNTEVGRSAVYALYTLMR